MLWFLAFVALAGPPARKAVFAGGCFWSMQKAFDGAAGVTATRAGFSGGSAKDPTYEQVSTGTTGHREAVEVTYDPAKTTYAQLLDVYWRNTDPYDGGGQFCDQGDEYKPAVFVADDEQKTAFEKTKKKDYQTAMLPAAPFYPANESHQHFAKKNPMRYEAYRLACGRDRRLEEIRRKP